MNLTSAPRFCVFGAGSVGCYLGGRLSATGASVGLIGRARIGAELAEYGLRLSDYCGAELQVPSSGINFAEIADAAANANVVLVTVKTAATRDVGRMLAPVLKAGALVISFQNGLHNAEWLRAALPRQTVLTGMVPFNVLARGRGRFHQGSGGELSVEQNDALSPELLQAFERAGLPLKTHADIRAVQWAKLLLNLNNPVNALSGLPLKQELSQRGYRRCVAAAQREALSLLGTVGIRPAKLTTVPPRLFPRLLELPEFLFRRVAGAALTIDPLARSSMWEDLEAGRATEIDWINGEVVQLAQSQGRDAPVNAGLTRLIHAAERGGRRDWSASELLAEIRRSG